jgi:hypothetical protein
MKNKGRLELQKTAYLQEYGGRKMEEDTQAFNGMLEMWGIHRNESKAAPFRSIIFVGWPP